MVYSPEMRLLAVGYLQVGFGGHGICLYGRKMAQEFAGRSDVKVIERNLLLTGNLIADYQLLRDTAKVFASVDLVHTQVSIWGTGTWGRGVRALGNLTVFRLMCRAPLIVTLHDLNSLPDLTPPNLRSVIVELLKGPLRPGVRLVRQLARGRVKFGQLVRPLWDFDAFTPFLLARWAAVQARAVFVLTGVEKKVLETFGITSAAVHVPHFVGPHTANPTRLSGKTVVVAGHMFDSKGHDLVIEAMALAPSIRVVFVGGDILGARFDQLMELARVKGVSDRLTVTGYLPDEEYAQQLAAADLGVCAFGPNKSASCSLPALIAADCPILASAIPVVAEYNDIVPGSVHTFAPSTPKVLAERIEELLAVPRSDLTKGLEDLRDRLSIARIADRHLDKYRLAVGRSKPAWPAAQREERTVA